MVMTLEADYAVRIVEMLAVSNKRIDAHTISTEAHVPLRFALKILRKLVADGLIVSYKVPTAAIFLRANLRRYRCAR